MSSVHRVVSAAPAQVWDVLADRRLFPPWVVGMSAGRGGEASVTISLTRGSSPDSTGIGLDEDVTAGPTRLLPRLVRSPLLGWRNTETLRRLAFLAEPRPTSPRTHRC